jgi:hypothetical protein
MKINNKGQNDGTGILRIGGEKRAYRGQRGRMGK